ncbi:hypothetical protein ANCCAN_25893 [Ancylostoma caninum]|uniref:Uncharacterized protein n=1 Tax=Ancylostoma caninum TaxID=29170 RepID=A0A368F868_ANCCA|nr:hypothetical protein ANCCAN_25893 [Ancylostoma caninum]
MRRTPHSKKSLPMILSTKRRMETVAQKRRLRMVVKILLVTTAARISTGIPGDGLRPMKPSVAPRLRPPPHLEPSLQKAAANLPQPGNLSRLQISQAGFRHSCNIMSF